MTALYRQGRESQLTTTSGRLRERRREIKQEDEKKKKELKTKERTAKTMDRANSPRVGKWKGQKVKEK